MRDAFINELTILAEKDKDVLTMLRYYELVHELKNAGVK